MNKNQFENLKVGKKLVAVNNLNTGMLGVVEPMVESKGNELTVERVYVRNTGETAVLCKGHNDNDIWWYELGQVRFIRSTDNKVNV